MKLKAFFFLFLFAGCASLGGKNIPKTQLQMRSFQTRSFETVNTKLVLKAMLNVLQDEGFIVQNADSELGYLTATKEMDVAKGGEKFFAKIFGNGRWKKASVTECTANVTLFGKQTKVRVNFRYKVLDNLGGIREVEPIEDQVYYQNFFSKVDKGIFLQKEQI